MSWLIWNLPSESEDEEKEEKEENVEPPLTLTFLGAGSYNCILRYTDSQSKPWALRVTIFPKTTKTHIDQKHMSEKKILFNRLGLTFDSTIANKYAFLKRFRARAILQWIQSFKHIFGPSTLHVERPVQTFDTLYEMAENLKIDVQHLGKTLCSTLMQTKKDFKANQISYEWSVEKQEFLNSYRASMRTPDELATDAFCLLWFFATLGNTHLGFRHRDFKTDNLLLRTYDPPVMFQFHSKKHGNFAFVTSSVPVVIDFDFATLNSSNKSMPHDRFIVGTWAYAPPEAFIFKLYRPLLKTAMKENSLDDRVYLVNQLELIFGRPYIHWITSDLTIQGVDGYDQWAVGLILLKKLCHWNSFPLLDLRTNTRIATLAESFELCVITYLDFSKLWFEDSFFEDNHFLQTFFFNALLICAVQNESWTDPLKNVPDFYPRWLLHDNINLFRAAIRDEEFVAFRNNLQKVLQQFYFYRLLPILRQLFAWNPILRVESDWLTIMRVYLREKGILSDVETSKVPIIHVREKDVDTITLPDIE